MMRILVTVWGCLILCLAQVAGGSSATGHAEPYWYQKTVGPQSVLFSWEIGEQNQEVTITVREGDTVFINRCAVDGTTLEWQFIEGELQNVTVRRDGNVLHSSGIRNGKPFQEEMKIDERPWFQPLTYSLRSFLDSDEPSTTFWSIRADTIDPVALEATKIKEEFIEIKGEMIAAQRVEVRIDGFLSGIWHGTYWYRKSDKIFLLYRGTHGLPGSAETVISLAPKVTAE